MSDTAGNSGSTGSRSLNYEALKNHIVTHKIDCSLWAIRILSILFAIGYIIPIFG